MTKKDYVFLAAILRTARQEEDPLEWIVDETAKWFGEDNPRFDRARYLEACYRA